MKQKITNLWRRLFPYFFKNGELGVKRFLICFFLPPFTILALIFLIGFRYQFISSILASFIVVAPIVLILAIVLACFGLFKEPENV